MVTAACVAHHTDVQSDVVATGLANKLGNKGGVAVSFCVGQTSLLFICSHFAGNRRATGGALPVQLRV